MAVRFDNERRQWIVEFEQKGIRIFQRLPRGCTESQAKAREAQLRREIYDRETLHKVPPLTLEGAINQWLTEDHRRKDRKKMASEAKQWLPHIRGKLLRDVPEVAQVAIAAWTQQPLQPKSRGSSQNDPTSISSRNTSPATVNRRLAMMKAVCRHAYKQGRIAENLSGRITVLPEDNKREVYLNKDQVRVLAKGSEYPKAIWLTAYTGLRASELLALPKMPPRSDTLRVIGKGNKLRHVPVPPVAQRYLSALPLECSYWQLHKDFLRARKAVGIKGLRFHDLRHTTASWLINAGVDIYTLSKILGHSSIATTQRYAHLYHSTLQDAMGRLR